VNVEKMDIHIAFTNISAIIDGANLKNMDTLKRKAFLIPILTELQENSFKAGKKEAAIETIKHLKNQL
jgi:hypothetical protein